MIKLLPGAYYVGIAEEMPKKFTKCSTHSIEMWYYYLMFVFNMLRGFYRVNKPKIGEFSRYYLSSMNISRG
ncbi:MAG: hypothetical protein CVU91_03010 [Firmicutes bacterium HGW-Firmicutes-16]|nr:MAG: hypothetical protein CVU91_03010 [Firmicutes bacterium HGW-Firmicutes-16]